MNYDDRSPHWRQEDRFSFGSPMSNHSFNGSFNDNLSYEQPRGGRSSVYGSGGMYGPANGAAGDSFANHSFASATSQPSQSSPHRSFQDQGNNRQDYYQYAQQPRELEKLGLICRELHGTTAHSLNATAVINRLFLDSEIDLFRIPEPPSADPREGGIQAELYHVLRGAGPLMDRACADPRTAQALFRALRIHADKSPSGGPETANNIAFRFVTEWCERLLPLQTAPSSAPASPSTLHTPLGLFLPECSFLLAVPAESGEDTQIVRGAHLACQLIQALCDTQQYPSIHRLQLLRLSIRAVHTFCRAESTDGALLALKKALQLRSPFTKDLYTFLYTTLEQCPSIHSFKEIVSVWLTFVRPWRYPTSDTLSTMNTSVNSILGGLQRPKDYSQFTAYFDAHQRFYVVLYGKILRRLRELSLLPECAGIVKTVVECAYRPGTGTAFEHFRVDVAPPLTLLLDYLGEIAYGRGSQYGDDVVDDIDREEFALYEGSQAVATFNQFKEDLKRIIQDASPHIQYAPRPQEPAQNAIRHVRRRTQEPDSYVDESTGLRMLTPLGRRQVNSGERSFDFSGSAREARGSPLVRLLESPMLKGVADSLLVHRDKPSSPVPVFSRFRPHLHAALKPEAKQAAGIVLFFTALSLIFHPLFFIFALAYLFYLHRMTQHA